MNTNFSRPSLGINQSLLFQVSDELATNSLSRSEFAKNPDFVLSKYGIPSMDKSIVIKAQKTSEICTPAFAVCAALVLVLIGAAAAAIALTYTLATTINTVHCVTEIDGCNIILPASDENYIGIC